jgi:hypothetical protein
MTTIRLSPFRASIWLSNKCLTLCTLGPMVAAISGSPAADRATNIGNWKNSFFYASDIALQYCRLRPMPWGLGNPDRRRALPHDLLRTKQESVIMNFYP